MVEQIFLLPLHAGNLRCEIQFLAIKKVPTQGLRLRIEKASIEVENQHLTDLVLWTDTAPDTVTFEVSGKAEHTLKIWNVWRIDGIMQAWVGNTGMVISNNDGGTTLRCSDGTQNVSFDDLVAHLKFRQC